MTNYYDDIIDLPHPVSTKHPPMSMLQRAAQFAPFAALTGHGAAIQEAGRLTDTQKVLEEYDNRHLNEKMASILTDLSQHPSVTITYFLPDARKEGGAYVTTSGVLRKYDEYLKVLTLEDGTQIGIPYIIDVARN